MTGHRLVITSANDLGAVTVTLEITRALSRAEAEAVIEGLADDVMRAIKRVARMGGGG